MGDPFVHLRVASGYSLQYGASHPSALVAAAADHEQDTLALTDRDGLYGAVRFAKACLKTGIAPVVGVDFAVPFGPDHPQHPGHARPAARRSAARGGEIRDPRLPRVVTVATSRRGWAQLCRLTSATHLAGQRGTPISTPELVGRHSESGDLLVMLGADSELGLAVARGRLDHAEAELRRWLDLVDPRQLIISVTNHQVAGKGVGSAHQAGAMLALADAHQLTGVLTNQVRMAHRHQAATVDVLDAARRLVPLDSRNIDRRNAEGYLKSGKELLVAAEEVARFAGRTRHGVERLLNDTRTTAIRARLDPRADIGLGEIHLPEFDVLGTTSAEAMSVLRRRCEAGIASRYGSAPGTLAAVTQRLDDELGIIAHLGFASYFLTVADVVDMIRDLGIRCAARGSGAGSVVNYLLGISGVDPLAYGLVMERFLSPLRQALPDIDLDVESARRTEIYDKVLEVLGGERVACVAMIDTYRVRHAVRDVGAALSLPPAEIDAIAKAFPHIRAADARAALRDLPELRAAGLGERRLDVLFRLVESLDGLPRHLALHPCGVLLSDTTLGDRTPLESSFGGYPMSQFDKDDVEDMGLLKLDILGIRMQSAMAHALTEIDRTTGSAPDIDALAPFNDADTYDLIAHAATLGCFQIESPGQRELIGKFGPETFDDIIIDISLFRPGPVKSDMIVPFLNARQGWAKPNYLHPSLIPALADTGGVVVFHEQIIKIVAIVADCSYAQADEARRALGDPAGQLDVKQWLFPRARARGYDERTLARIWFVLESFASFGFCKAHAAAFALPTYQSAWLKRHYPAHFLSGILTHDPGMYPKRLLLEEARRMGIAILGVDINAASGDYHVEPVERSEVSLPVAPVLPTQVRPLDHQGLPDASEWGIRLSLADVKGISAAEIARITSGQPYSSLSDFWARAQVEAPVVERLILAGGFDQLYGIGRSAPVLRQGQITRRDLLLALADLKRLAIVEARSASRARGLRRRPLATAASDDPRDLAKRQARSSVSVERRVAMPQTLFDADPTPDLHPDPDPGDVSADDMAADHLGSALPRDVQATGLPEMTDSDRLAAELDILGLDASQHIVEFYRDFLVELGVTPTTDLLRRRNQQEVLIAGVKVATQTPPVRSGRRVIFLTLDDATGPSDATFFEDVQGPYAATVFSSWLLVVRGDVRRTGPRGISVRATGAWDLQQLHSSWQAALTTTGDRAAAIAAVQQEMAVVPIGYNIVGEPLLANEATPQAGSGSAAQSSQAQPLGNYTDPAPLDDPSLPTGDRRPTPAATRPSLDAFAYADWVPGERRGGAGYSRDAGAPEQAPDQAAASAPGRDQAASATSPDTGHHTRAGGMGRRRVLVHASGFTQSPYADVRPSGVDTSHAPPTSVVPNSTPSPGAMVAPPSAEAPRKLWHSSPGSSGR